MYRCPSDYGPLDLEDIAKYDDDTGEGGILRRDYLQPDGDPYLLGDRYFENEGLSYEYPSYRSITRRNDAENGVAQC